MKHSDPWLTQSSMGSMVQSLLMARQGQGKPIPWKVMSLSFRKYIYSFSVHLSVVPKIKLPSILYKD